MGTVHPRTATCLLLDRPWSPARAQSPTHPRSEQNPSRRDTHSNHQVEAGDVVLLRPHRHGGFKDGARRQCEGDGGVLAEGDVLLGQEPRPGAGSDAVRLFVLAPASQQTPTHL